MVSVTRRYLNGQPVEREDIEKRPVDSERVKYIVEHLRRRAER